MFKNKVGPLVLVLGVASSVCGCSSSAATTGGGGASATGGSAAATGGGGASATGGSGASAATGGSTVIGGGGASTTGGSATTGGSDSTGGTSASGGSGGATLTLAEACAKNCSLAAMGVKDMNGMVTCDTTTDVCVASCLKTFDNTSAVNPHLGVQYTAMMVCVANHAMGVPPAQISTPGTNTFTTSADFVCSKPASGASVPALNKWSPGPMSDCEQMICDWNCTDGTPGNRDAFIDIRCSCSSV